MTALLQAAARWLLGLLTGWLTRRLGGAVEGGDSGAADVAREREQLAEERLEAEQERHQGEIEAVRRAQEAEREGAERMAAHMRRRAEAGGLPPGSAERMRRVYDDPPVRPGDPPDPGRQAG